MTTAVEQRTDLLAEREVTELAEELRALARKGLPLSPDGGRPRLESLASVTARTDGEKSPAARAEALDWVLRRALLRLDDQTLRKPAKALFGVEPVVPGSNLTARRESAAAAYGKEVNHFRKRVEPMLLTAVARTLLREAAEQAQPWASPPPVCPGRRRRHLPEDVFAWEASEHEEALARLWTCVYALRAELLAVERQVSMGERNEAAAAADAALWRYGQLQAQARRYRAAYGGRLLPDGTAGPHELAVLAGWAPRLSQTDTTLVADASSVASAHLFMLTVHAAPGGDALIRAWRAELTDLEEET